MGAEAADLEQLGPAQQRTHRQVVHHLALEHRARAEQHTRLGHLKAHLLAQHAGRGGERVVVCGGGGDRLVILPV